MPSAGAIRAGQAYVEVFADNSSLYRGLTESEMALKKFGMAMKSLGTTMTHFISLPIAGIGAAAVLNSAMAKAAFKNMWSSIKSSFGMLGDQLARDLDLRNSLESISSKVRSIIEDFNELPKAVRIGVEAIAGIAFALGPSIKIVGIFSTLIAKLGPVWTKLSSMIGVAAAGILGVGAAITATVAAGLAAGYALNKLIMPQGTKAEETRTSQVSAALANKAFEQGRSNLLVPGPKAAPVESFLPDMDAAIKSFKEQGLLESEIQEQLKSLGEGRRAQAGGTMPGLPSSQDLESFLRLSSQAAEKGMPEGALKARADQAKQIFEATLGELAPVFNKFSDETWGTYFERLANGIRDGSQDLKQMFEDTQGKRIFGPMAKKFEEDQKRIQDALTLTNQTAEDKLGAVEQELKAATDAWMKMRDATKGAAAQGIHDTMYLDQQRDKVVALRKEMEALKREEVLRNAQRDISQAKQTSDIQGGGVNLQEEQRQTLIGAYNKISAMPSFEGQAEQVQNLRTQIEALQTPMQAFIGQLQAIPPLWQQIGTLLSDTLNTVTAGIGNMVAQALIYQQDIGKLGLALLKQIGAQVITTIIQIGIQQLIASLIGKLAFASEVVGKMAGYAAMTYAAVYAANAGIPIIGPAVAAGIAAGAVTAMIAGATTASVTGAGAGLAMSAYDKGGISLNPQLAAVSERGHPELHLTRPNIKKYFPEMFGGGGNQHIQVFLDRDVLIDAVARGMPDVLRLHGVIA